MKSNFCTITTYSHLFKCFALAGSIAPFGGFLNILIVDKNQVKKKIMPLNVKFHFLEDLNTSLAKQIKIKYVSKIDKLRWSLKSVYLLFLLEEHIKIIYVDNDIFFYNNFNFLFDELDEHPILLTPHHYKRNPKSHQNWLEANFRVGLYNAGFVAVNTTAKPTLQWWAEACLYRCEKNYWRGLFDDQKYLDIFPVIEPNTKVLTHKGCNVAAWNKEICNRTYINGQHIINNTDLLIFYHFNNYSLQVLDKNDKLIMEYIYAIKTYKEDVSTLYIKKGLNLIDQIKLSFWKILNKINK